MIKPFNHTTLVLEKENLEFGNYPGVDNSISKGGVMKRPINSLFLVAILLVCSSLVNAAGKPNILLVMADDMGWTDLGSFGGEIDTPNLDTLAREGVKFTDFHTSMSCSPTRSMLLSGTDNHLAGLGNMGELLTPEQKGKPGYEGHLNNRVVSLAEVLKVNGYHTYMAGKWHLGHTPDTIPYARGFEKSLSSLFGGASYWSDMFGMLAEVEEVAEYVENDKWLKSLPKDFYATRTFTDYLINAIRVNKDDGKPFLAYLAFTAPHDPLHVPEPWLSKYHNRYDKGYEVLKAERIARAKELGVVPVGARTPDRYQQIKPWESLSDEERQREARAMEVYAGLVNNMDYHFGRVIQFLKDIGEYENTIILFLSDNGPNPWYSEDYPGNAGSEWFSQFDNSTENIGHPMSHYAYGMGWSAASAGPLDLFKMTVGEGGIRSPLLISGPGFKGGRQNDAFTYVWDLMPTILDIAGIEHPEKFKGRNVKRMRGKSLKEILTGSSQNVYAKEAFVGGEMLNGKWMRQGDYKAVSIAAPYGTGAWHLFNVKRDPGETQNIAGDHPALLKKLQTQWEMYADEVGVILTE